MATEHTTRILLRRARGGDDEAMNDLVQRYLIPLQRWAAGRLPRDARATMETSDIVQEAFFRAIPHLHKLEEEGQGAVLAYMRQTVLNLVRNEVNRLGRRPQTVEADTTIPARDRSPLDELLGKETAARYEHAMSSLSPTEREAVTMRLEFGFPYQEIAIALGSPSANAARMMVSRAVARVAESMAEGDGTLPPRR